MADKEKDEEQDDTSQPIAADGPAPGGEGGQQSGPGK